MIGKQIQNYKILSLLGEGGMGVVYKAFDVKLERFAALKILNLNSTRFSRIIERFRQEAKNQAKLNHPNIVSVYGFVEERNVMGIAMEFVEGQTIEQILQIEDRLEQYHALDILSQALNGISYAHEMGFIHRDLKPSNIIIDLNGNVKIMDFGISKSIDEIESITQHNARPGTLLYMSPEQLNSKEVTIKSDLYSLGITFYEMISGHYPYDSRTFYEVIDAHVNKIPAKLSTEIPGVPFEIDELILKALGKSANYNFSSASEFNFAVNEIINKYKPDTSVITHNVIEDVPVIKKNKIPFWSKLGNYFLFIIFIVLAVVVYSVVKKTIDEKAEEDKVNQLNYTQDYSKNPNYIEKTDWQLSTVQQENNLNSIYFVDNLIGFIIGNNGLLLKTNNSGQNWDVVDLTPKVNYNAILYSNGRLFCVGEKGTLLRSNYDLKNWEKISTATNETFFNIKFVNDNVAFICGSHGLILKSEDGGSTWKKIPNNSKENLFSIDFSDDQTGFAVGWSGTILKTIDQGMSWFKINNNNKEYLKDICFTNQFLGFIVGGDGMILRTENGGTDWERIVSNTSSGLFRIYFENNEDGMILSNRGEIFKTTDAGKSWLKTNIGKPVVLNDVKKLTAGRYIVIGNNGSLFKSKVKTN